MNTKAKNIIFAVMAAKEFLSKNLTSGRKIR
jgi:hypothetical protein